MTTLLVANRGEVALRVFRTARRLGLRCAAVYSEADEDAPFVRQADAAFPIGPAPAADSYLRIPAVIDAAKMAGADLIHPGYGFLAEDAEFAEACERAGFTFVGPPPEVLRLMGSKDLARKAAKDSGVPVLDGYDGPDQSDDAFIAAAAKAGFPVIVKPAEGGGGKGMGVARDASQLPGVLAAARRVGKAAFGDDRLILERYLEDARHVEVQIIGDQHGRVVHLGERDCSLQRRHQKIVEESPAPKLDPAVRDLLHESAVSLAARVGYRNAGTCEFIVGSDGTAAFLEMNARLQVEHPVTEMVTIWDGTPLDLVEQQIRVAMGEPLPTGDPVSSGHSMEARIYAEDPANEFLPQVGRIAHLAWGPGVRIDSGVEEGTEVSSFYDPMIAKVIATADDRGTALAQLREALESTRILGVRTNLAFLTGVLRTDEVDSGRMTTTWLDSRPVEKHETTVPDEAFFLAAAAESARILESSTRSKDPWAKLGSWRPGGQGATTIVVHSVEGEERAIEVKGEGPFIAGGHSIEAQTDRHSWTFDGVDTAAARAGNTWFVWWGSQQFEIQIGPPERLDQAAQGHLDAPMPGQVLAVKVASGQHVTKGQDLVVVEAMKMEHTLRAPADGTVQAVRCAPGDQVTRGQVLVDFQAS